MASLWVVDGRLALGRHGPGQLVSRARRTAGTWPRSRSRTSTRRGRPALSASATDDGSLDVLSAGPLGGLAEPTLAQPRHGRGRSRRRSPQAPSWRPSSRLRSHPGAPSHPGRRTLPWPCFYSCVRGEFGEAYRPRAVAALDSVWAAVTAQPVRRIPDAGRRARPRFSRRRPAGSARLPRRRLDVGRSASRVRRRRWPVPPAAFRRAPPASGGQPSLALGLGQGGLTAGVALLLGPAGLLLGIDDRRAARRWVAGSGSPARRDEPALFYRIGDHPAHEGPGPDGVVVARDDIGDDDRDRSWCRRRRRSEGRACWPR